MNKLNPLYILLLCIIISLISFFKLSEIKNEFINSSNNLIIFTKNAREYNDLKNSWLNKNEIKKRVNNLLRNFKSSNYNKNEKKTYISIEFKSINKKKLSKFLNKLLNQKFILNKLVIKENSIFVQIRLR